MNKHFLSILLACTVLLYVQVGEICEAAPILPQNADISASVEFDTDTDYSQTDVIKRVSLRERFKKTPENQINALLKKYNKYFSSGNIEKLKELYADDYVNNDGFTKDVLFEMMAASSEVYKDLKYDMTILDIKTNGNYAAVKIHEIAKCETKKKLEKINDTGLAVSDIYYTDYLAKDGDKWKIKTTNIEYEKIELKYGEAKQMEFDVAAPGYVRAGSEYEVSINTKSAENRTDAADDNIRFNARIPSSLFAVGSIVNEPIVYPQVQSKDVFRAVKRDVLSRILKANSDNHNEYATVSLAFTRAQVEPDSVVLNMTGMAFVMKRINVFAVNNTALNKENTNE